MMRTLAAWWRLMARPSLGRRLLLAQMGVLTALWTVLTLALLLASHRDSDLLTNDALYDLAVAITDHLADAPDQQQQSLRALDMALRTEYGDGVEQGSFTPVVFVWQRGERIYQSHPDLPVARNQRMDTVEDIDVEGRTWRMRTRRSAATGTEVGIAIRDLPQLLITFNSRGYYLLPLLVSLPFLAFPAWWSVRLALRPWRRVSEEIATRGPDDLAPLSFQPRHAELRPFVRNINHLLRRVRESALRERALIADAAHELRTPLAAMRVNVEVLHQQATDTRQRELMQSLLRSNERATRMVQQLLQLMRSESPADTGAPQLLALGTLLQDRLAALDGLAAAHGVELELHAAHAITVRGEREGLVSMIDNLLDNAIKYSPPGATVRVHLSSAQGQARLEVIDCGPGIADALRERVFDRFYRAPDQVQSGSGLGLSIVRSVVLRHGGDIRLHAATDSGDRDGNGGNAGSVAPGAAQHTGLRVEVTLPMADASGAAGAAAASG